VSQSSHSESPQPAELIRVTLTLDHHLTDSEMEQLKLTAKALEVRAAGPSRAITTGDWSEAQPGRPTSVSVSAPPGWYLLSGGGEAMENRDVILRQSYPSNPFENQWICTFVNTGSAAVYVRAVALIQMVP
jgi:hypothetical protein